MKKSRVLLVGVLPFFVIACETKTETYHSEFSRQYKEGRSVAVKREDSYSQYYGIITHNKYGEDHSFTYSLTVLPGEHQWMGSPRQVPKKLLFCREDLLLVVSEQRTVVDTLHPENVPTLKDTTLYFRNVDNRWLFNLFGEQYFEPVDRSVYADKRTKCKEEEIPIGG